MIRKKKCFFIRKKKTGDVKHLVQGHKLKQVGLIHGPSSASKPRVLPIWVRES